jgi:hypothetical protein
VFLGAKDEPFVVINVRTYVCVCVVILWITMPRRD